MSLATLLCCWTGYDQSVMAFWHDNARMFNLVAENNPQQDGSEAKHSASLPIATLNNIHILARTVGCVHANTNLTELTEASSSSLTTDNIDKHSAERYQTKTLVVKSTGYALSSTIVRAKHRRKARSSLTTRHTVTCFHASAPLSDAFECDWQHKNRH